MLVMYAINLGRMPFNTFAFKIIIDSKRNKITALVSDFNNSVTLELI